MNRGEGASAVSLDFRPARREAACGGRWRSADHDGTTMLRAGVNHAIGVFWACACVCIVSYTGRKRGFRPAPLVAKL